MAYTDQTHPSRTSALIDLILIIGVLLGLKTLFLQIDVLWTYAGPISLVATLAFASWRLHRRGESWRGLGLGRPKSLFWTLIWTIVALVATIAAGSLADMLVGNFITPADAATETVDDRYQGRFADLPGNFSAFVFWLSIAWIVGGFTEEMLFRAAMISRIERLLNPLPLAAFIGVLGQAALFGQQHYYYQGLPGLLATGAIGLVSGILYLAFRRNLWPLVISHGLGNTIGLTLIYLEIPG